MRVASGNPLIVAGLRRLLAADDRVTLLDPDRDELGGHDELEGRDELGGCEAELTIVDPDRGLQLRDLVAAGLPELVRSLSGPVVVLSWSTAPSSVAQALAAGCAGYVHKGIAARALVAALIEVRAGVVVVPGDGSTGPDPEPPAAGAAPTPLPALTPRERDVLDLVAAGRTNAEIAAELGLSVNSVKSHVSRAYRRIGAQNRSQAVRWVVSGQLDLGVTSGR